MIANCQSCDQNKQIIAKYVKLTKLLQVKCKKTSKSLIQNQTFTLDTVLSTITQNGSNSKNINIQESSINNKSTTVSNKQNKHYKLSLLIIFNLHKKCILRQGFSGIKQFLIKKMFSSKLKSTPNNLNIGKNHQKITQIAKTQNNEVTLKDRNTEVPQYNLKQVYKKKFILQAKNSKYQQKIILLEKQLEQTEKRFFKQSDKKRQSLQSVAEEIRQKDQLIVELKQTIKIYEKKLGKSTFFLATNNILIQNEQQISKRCTRLESVNQSLNLQIRNANSKIQQLNQQVKNCHKQLKKFQAQIIALKQQNFDMCQSKLKSDEVKSLYLQLCAKFDKKMEKLKRMEKQNINSCKVDQNQTSKHHSLTKNTEITDFSPISKKSAFKEFQMQQKIECIFSYLYDIQDEKFEIMNEHIFDEDELNLLKQHKTDYLTNIRLQNERNEIKTQKLLKNDRMDETDLIFYVQAQNQPQQNSFFNALQTDPKSIPSLNQHAFNMKLMQMTVENSKLVDKISDLKNMNMHTRNVILNLLKSLDFTTAKPQYENILQIIFDTYEYSEEQKALIFKDKKKRFWGLL